MWVMVVRSLQSIGFRRCFIVPVDMDFLVGLLFAVCGVLVTWAASFLFVLSLGVFAYLFGFFDALVGCL